MDLVELQSEEEMNDFIKKLKNIETFALDTNIFIGGTKMGKSFWYWLNGRQNIDLSGKWLSGEPRNVGGREQCLSIGKRSEVLE